jgi:hypothetical protein
MKSSATKAKQLLTPVYMLMTMEAQPHCHAAPSMMCGATTVVYPRIRYAESGVVQLQLHVAAAGWPPTD